MVFGCVKSSSSIAGVESSSETEISVSFERDLSRLRPESSKSGLEEALLTNVAWDAWDAWDAWEAAESRTDEARAKMSVDLESNSTGGGG